MRHHLQFLDDSLARETALAGHYDGALVLLSVLVATLAAYAALGIASRMRSSATSSARRAWLLVGALSMGTGIWAMHFIGMLAFRLPSPVRYDVAITAVSVVPALLSSGVVLQVMSGGSRSAGGLLALGSLMGGGIGAMHYTGMAAMRMDAAMYYDPVLFAGSIFVAVLLATISLAVNARAGRNEAWWPIRWSSVAPALVMGFAVAGMHYAGMAGAYFFPVEGGVVSGGLNPSWLGVWVAAATLLITCVAIAITLVHRRMSDATQAERTSQSRLLASVEGIGDGFCLFDTEDRLVLCNAGFRAMHAVEGAEIQPGAPFETILRACVDAGMIADAQASPDEWMRERMGRHRAPRGPQVQRRSDGRWLRIDEHRAEGIGTVGVYADITELKRAEAQAEDRAREASLLHRGAELAADTDSIEDALRHACETVCAFTGWPLGHAYRPSVADSGVLEPTNIWTLPDENGFASLREATRTTRFTAGIGLPGRVLDSGAPAWIPDVQREVNFPRNRVASDLGVRGAFAFPVKIDSEIVAVLEFFSEDAVSEDPRLLRFARHAGEQLGRVFERMRAAEELRASEERFRRLVEGLRDEYVFVSSDRNGRVRYISPSIENVLGTSAEEAIRRGYETFVTDSPRNSVGLAALEAGLRGKRQPAYDLELRHEDGSNRILEILDTPVLDAAGLLVSIDSICRDVTRIRAAEDELRSAREAADAANRAKSAFLSNMSHELRTPLNGVLGYTQLLRRDPSLTGDQRHSLESIESCGEHLLELINDVLDLSKIEAGRLEIDPAPCDLHALLSSVEAIVRQRARAKGLELDVDIPLNFPRWIVTDGAKLRQVLVNLLGNAVKFTERGRVSLEMRETREGHFAVAVRDTGIGISAAEAATIFDPFRQASAGRDQGGTGLGLAISRRITRALGGSLELESAQGQGSTFTVHLPLVESEPEVAPAEEALSSEGVRVLAPGRRLEVLVADDRETNRDLLARLLRQAGFDTREASDGEEALESLRERPAPLVLMDLRMPKLDGLGAVRAIRDDPALAEAVVIAVSASAFPEFQEQAVRQGFDDFVAKPIRAQELFAKIEQHIPGVFVDEDPEQPSAQAASERLSRKDAANVGTRLREALGVGDVSGMHTLARELRSSGVSDEADTIERLAQAFDFDGLRELAGRLERNDE